MNQTIKRRLLSRLLAKPVPERYSISTTTEAQRHYDWISIRGETDQHSDVMLLSLDEKTLEIEYLWWPAEQPHADARKAHCQLSEVKWRSLKASHRYGTWDIEYDSLVEAYVHDLLRLPNIKWAIQSIRDKFIRPIRPNYQIQMLTLMVDLHNAGQPIKIDNLLASVFGSAIRLSDDRYLYLRQLQFLIESLVESGNASTPDEENRMRLFGEDDVVPTPKAISTLADYDFEMKKLRQAAWLARCQMLLGLGMLAIAAASLYIKLNGY